ncbi:MAG TPA: hypothetical protein VFL86_24510 [Burkholderiaceae bacterium]|nr:hypothetical protein [Burkholderiaceae bacterium]
MYKTAFTAMIIAVLAGPAGSAAPELSVDTMQAIEDLNKSLASNIALRDAKGGTSDAKELDTLFAEVEAHFVARGDAENAVTLSKKTRTLALQIVSFIEAKDFSAATDAATDLARTCKTCHNFYKKE